MYPLHYLPFARTRQCTAIEVETFHLKCRRLHKASALILVLLSNTTPNLSRPDEEFKQPYYVVRDYKSFKWWYLVALNVSLLKHNVLLTLIFKKSIELLLAKTVKTLLHCRGMAQA